jgi:hypothetical protein
VFVPKQHKKQRLKSTLGVNNDTSDEQKIDVSIRDKKAGAITLRRIV